MRARLFIAAAAFVAVEGAAAEIYRCVTPAGSVSYQELPCGPTHEGSKVAFPTSFPDVNEASRDVLLSREAALDRRLEAQRERLSREEMTRIAARAQVAAAGATAPAAAEPVYVYGWPARPSRMPSRAHRPQPRIY